MNIELTAARLFYWVRSGGLAGLGAMSESAKAEVLAKAFVI